MNRKFLSILMLACLTLVVGACSSDGDGAESPHASLLLSGNDERPATWFLPDYSLFEMTMSVQVQLGDTLVYFQSDEDQMCATIGGEVRAVTGALTTGDVACFPLVIAGGSDDESVSLCYYCARLHRIYMLNDWATFDSATVPTGTSGIYRPKFVENAV